jgi:predicted O-linked N-acetylglucosamine transferase (SPINDLY family)
MGTRSMKRARLPAATAGSPSGGELPPGRQSVASEAKTAAQWLAEGLQAQQAGQLERAETSFLNALKRDPGNWAAHYSLAVIASSRGLWAIALDNLNAGLASNRNHPQLLQALAQVTRALAAQGSSPEQEGEQSRPARGQPPADWGDLMQVLVYCEGLSARGEKAEAVLAYRKFLQSHRGDLAYAALFNLSVLQSQMGQTLEAEASMRHAIRLKHDFFPARINLGTLLETAGRQEEAVEVWKDALALPEIEQAANSDYHVQLANNLGRLLEILRRYDEAELALARSLRVRPGQTPAIGHWLHLRQKMCKWPAWHGLGLTRNEVLSHASALGMMAQSDDPQQQLDCSRRFVNERVESFERMVPRHHRYQHSRIRLGFLSSDLCMHAVSLLTVEMFEKIDRSRFELHAFCWSREDGTAFRERVRSAFDVFHKIGDLTDEQAAKLVTDNEIDVVFDLQGLTSGARPNIVARGPAPIQISYLGFVGSSALPYIDYIIADKFLFPDTLRPFFTEEPLYLPFFQVSDSKRIMGPRPTREQFGLPNDTFVYCSLNNNYKITPDVFATWMRILLRVPNTVLWLLEDNPWSKENLVRAAMVHGIAPERLFFTGRIDPRDYLARFTVADLFLDTAPYGAGTTANDALWAGLPVLTCPGDTYVSRMAGALLHACGQPELVARDRSSYEEKAVELGTQPERLASLRRQIQALSPERRIPFNTDQFCRDLETAINELLARQVPEQSVTRAKPINDSRLRLLVRGWRNINHSYAMVNQHQLAALAVMDDVELFHEDLPMIAHWKPVPGGSGLPVDLQSRIDRIPPYRGQPVAASYTIASPWSLYRGDSKADFTFMVTEFGPDPETLIKLGHDFREFTSRNRRVITPSSWSRRKLVEAGLDADRVVVIPHGVDTTTFFPVPPDKRQSLRAAMGLHPHDFVLLNVGGAFWNKGIDLLIRAYATLKPDHPQLRLMMKDNRALYGRSSEQLIAEVQAEFPDLITPEILSGILTVPGTLTTYQLADLYRCADLYVSPYRAEGFNLPVLEAMACGLRVAVTKGGATDDFFVPEAGVQIKATTVSRLDSPAPVAGDYLEPDVPALIESVKNELNRSEYSRSSIASPDWDSIASSLASEIAGSVQNPGDEQ